MTAYTITVAADTNVVRQGSAVELIEAVLAALRLCHLGLLLRPICRRWIEIGWHQIHRHSTVLTPRSRHQLMFE